MREGVGEGEGGGDGHKTHLSKEGSRVHIPFLTKAVKRRQDVCPVKNLLIGLQRG